MSSRSWLCGLRVWLGLAMASAGLAQAPMITSLQSSRSADEETVLPPLLGNAITSGTPLQVFYLVINGQFRSGAFKEVRWTNTSTGQTAVFHDDCSLGCNVVENSATRIGVRVVSPLFSQLVTSPQTVNIVVVEYASAGASVLPSAVTLDPLNGSDDRISNVAPFFLNPPMINRPLPNATVGVAYAEPLITGGTPPYQVSVNVSALPPGMTVPSDDPTLRGTPTMEGNFTFAYQIEDAWMNGFEASAGIRVYRPPVLASLDPASRIAGLGDFQLTATGSNFSTEEGNSSRIVFGGTALSTTFVNSTTLRAMIPGALVAAPATVPVLVRNASNRDSNIVNFQLVPSAPLAIVTSSLPTATIGQPYSAQLAGTGGVGAYAWSATGLPAGFSINPATGSISGTANTASAAAVTVTLRDSINQTATRQYTLNVTAPSLAILTSALPAATAGRAYTAQLTGTGGIGAYTWSATGLPAGLSINTTTGLISGSPANPGTAAVAVTLRDSINQSITANYTLTVVEVIEPLNIGGSLPNGQVGVPYAGSVSASGGRGGYAFSAGSLPGGLTISSGGAVSGTPTTAGVFRVSITVTDSAGSRASREFTVEILPPPLAVTGAIGDVPMSSPMSVTFGATGGVPPYTFGVTGSIPSGTTFSGTTLSGTPNSMGTFAFTVSVTDSTGKFASRGFTIRVTAPRLQLTGSAGNGQVGVPYSAVFSATGGVPPYSFAASGLPSGLSLQGSSISGTPTTRGTFPVSVTATDSDGGRATGSFTVVIDPPSLTITGSLPNGAVGVPYSASLGASGGVPPYSWSISGAPAGVTASSGGSLTGTPTQADTFTVSATVTDSTGKTDAGTFRVVISPIPLEVATTSLQGGTAGATYGGSLAATGGVPPYSWTASGLPSAIELSAGGGFSGTPVAPGTANVTVTVRDSMGSTASRVLTLAVGLPSTPPVNVTGLPANSNPGTQQQFQIGLGSPYPGPVTVVLTLTFAADTGPDDPAVQFQSGGRTLTLTIPAGSLTTPNIGIQVGTVAGLATITARLTAFSTDITPTPPPTQTIRVNATAPVITSVTAARTPTGFTVTISGFCSSREITQAAFAFTAATGADLQTTQLTVPVDALFTQWFGSTASAPFGSQFTLTLPFNVQGSAQSIVSLTVRLVSRDGSSTTVSANIQ